VAGLVTLDLSAGRQAQVPPGVWLLCPADLQAETVGRERAELVRLGTGGRWWLEQPSLHQSMQAGCSLQETKAPPL